MGVGGGGRNNLQEFILIQLKLTPISLPRFFSLGYPSFRMCWREKQQGQVTKKYCQKHLKITIRNKSTQLTLSAHLLPTPCIKGASLLLKQPSKPTLLMSYNFNAGV